MPFCRANDQVPGHQLDGCRPEDRVTQALPQSSSVDANPLGMAHADSTERRKLRIPASKSLPESIGSRFTFEVTHLSKVNVGEARFVRGHGLAPDRATPMPADTLDIVLIRA